MLILRSRCLIDLIRRLFMREALLFYALIKIIGLISYISRKNEKHVCINIV